jgi:outer membrane protein assembly factor BamD (BamD/ComL family)
MATKVKRKQKATKKAVGRVSAAAKSVRLKAKPAKATSRNGAKPRPRISSRLSSKVESRRPSVAAASPSRPAPVERTRSKNFDSAVHAYEAGLKFMHAEEFEKAKRSFSNLIAEHVEEPEIQERAKVLLLACEKKIQEKGRTVLRSADDYYNLGVAELNRRELNTAIQHLQHALKLMPKGEHILYALATANALNGNRDQALHYLKLSIQYRGENRFLAARDSDFDFVRDDTEFKQLVASSDQ